jgi:hypothetical protein
VPAASDFAIVERPGGYTVYNNSNPADGWYILAFEVENPLAASGLTVASTTRPDWFAQTLDTGALLGLPSFFYSRESVSDFTLPGVLASLIGPGESDSRFTYSDVLAASAYLLYLYNPLDTDGNPFDFVGGNAVETPIPAALPLFAGGLGLIGFIAQRRKRPAVRNG